MMRTVRRRVLGLPLLFVVVLMLGGVSAAIAALPTAYEDLSPMTIDARSDIAGEERFAALDSAMAAEGSVRVIVGLRMLWTPEALLDSPAVATQEATIELRQESVLSSLRGTEHVVLHRYRYVPYLALELGEDALDALQASNLAASVQLDVAEPVALDESVPLVNADDTWGEGFDGTGLVVAILDSGVDSSHSFLGGRVVEEACYSSLGDCPNASTVQVGAGAGVHCTYSGDCDHGTHVAGIAAGYASPTNAGVAPDADIMAVQVFSRFDSATVCDWRPVPCALSYQSDQLAGLERVFEVRNAHDFAAVNVSIGGGEYTATCDTDSRKAAIDNLLAAGIPTVISAGNDSFEDATTAPGCISTAVTVASSTVADVRSDFSNSASFVDLIAPGSAINSSVPDEGFESWNGTSMAAPHVTGAWALLKEARPDASVADILAALQDTGPLIQVRSSPDEYLPRIDVLAALDHLLPDNDDFVDAVAFMAPYTTTVSNRGATTESGEPLLCDDPDLVGFVSPLGATVWYSFTPTEDVQVTVDTTGSDFDTVLGIYTGGGVGSLTQIACDDDSFGSSWARVTFVASAGVAHHVQLGGYGSTPVIGTADLSITSGEIDSEVPFWPPAPAISVDDVGVDSISLSWPTAYDNVGVAGYLVSVDGLPLASTASTTTTLTSLMPETTYTLDVQAYDAAGNRTTDGPETQVTTLGSGVLPPNWPDGSYIAFSNISTHQVDVSWSAAEDDLAVTHYAIWVHDQLQGYTGSQSYTIDGLDPAMDYWITVTAGDANSNWTHGPADWVTTATDFLDTDGSVFEADIIWLSGAGITAGCNPPWNDLFCPGDFVTRGQMAAFLVRALGLTDDGGGDLFADDDGSVFEPSIDRLAASGITKGCNPPVNDEFCPGDYVTRGQMAAFLVRAVGYTDDGGGNLFIDDDGSVFEGAIDKLGTAGVTRGCNPPVNDRFCPTDRVTRGQMAAFLRRALG